jgi:hypothetical protein
MLLSWLIDEKPLDDGATWATYYSVLVNFDCFQAVRKRAALLVNISTTLNEWHQSIYGQLLRITDPLTLAKVRQFWVKYSKFANRSSAALDNIREKFMQRFFCIHEEKSRGKSLSGMRSVGATCMNPQAMESVTEEFERFWKSGVIGSLRELTEAATYINPLFVHSNIGADECVIHYGTDPILGFHCVSVFAETIPTMSSVFRYSQRSTLDENVNRLARSAMLQFKQWCAAFQSVARSALLDPTLLKIHNFAGDALELCYTLQSASGKIKATDNIFQTCAAPWKQNLDLDSNSLGRFDVIDTSNIADHVGLLNILTCALPLLKHTANSVLYSENLAQSTTNYPPFERLKTLLCGEPSTIFALLRAAPIECLTGVTTTCTLHEEFTRIILSKAGGLVQLHWRLAWKDITLGDQRITTICKTPPLPSWDTDSLAHSLVSLYNGMFKDEDFSTILNKKPDSHLMPKHYNRASFVALLKMVQSRYHSTNWSDVINKFIDLISKDNPFSLQSQGAQELFLQLHLQRLHTTYVMQEALKSEIYIPDAWKDVFRQSPLPLTIPILFRIPRAACQHILNEFNPIQAVTDIVFEIVVSSPPISNSYCSLQFVFANQVSCLPAKWSNSQDLIAYVFIPTWTIFTRSRRDTSISLALSANLPVIQQFFPLLGPGLTIFKTSLSNTEYVIPKFTQQFPSVSCITPVVAISAISRTGFRSSVPKITAVDGKIQTTIRIDVTGHNKSKLESGEQVDSSQNSSCTYCVILGNSNMEIVLPFPSEYCRSHVRIARKSGWIEVVTKFSTNASGSSFNFASFPIIKEAKGCYYSWNLPRLSSQLLPRLKLSTNNNNWIKMNISAAFSIRERVVRERHLKDQVSGDIMVDLKENIFSLFIEAGKSKLEHPKVFFLHMQNSGIMTLIFLVGMRLDSNSSTIVADSYILPLNPILVSTLRKELSILRANGGIPLPCTANSYELWTLYIKATVERSRTWEHCENCTGKLQDGRVDHLQQFLCRCGAGKNVRDFEEIREWKVFLPFVTHCLFTPIFPVQCMESSIDMDSSKFGSMSLGGNLKELDVDKSCFKCGIKEIAAGGKLMSCMGCGTAMYCSKKCQKKDWKHHKLSCRSD